MLRVEQHDAELLDGARPERRQQVAPPRRAACAAGCARRARARASGGRARAPRPACAALRRSDAGDLRQIVAGRSHQPVQTAARRAAARWRRRARRPLRAAAAEHERHQLVVAERRRAVTQQLLARTIVGRQVFHRTTAIDGPRYLGDAASRRCPRCMLSRPALHGGACGGDPPEKEMQQAQGAIDAARAAGAEQYAARRIRGRRGRR